MGRPSPELGGIAVDLGRSRGATDVRSIRGGTIDRLKHIKKLTVSEIEDRRVRQKGGKYKCLLFNNRTAVNSIH